MVVVTAKWKKNTAAFPFSFQTDSRIANPALHSALQLSDQYLLYITTAPPPPTPTSDLYACVPQSPLALPEAPKRRSPGGGRCSSRTPAAIYDR